MPSINLNSVLILFLLVFGLASTAVSQPISIQAGITVFCDPSGKPASYVEFPFTANRSDFEFYPSKDGGAYTAAIFAELIISDTLDNHLDSVSTLFYSRVNDLSDGVIKGIKLFNKLSLMINPGIYKAALSLIDVYSKREGSFNYDRIEIEPVSDEYLALSGLELAYDIRFFKDTLAEKNSRLAKNGREILASPMGIFSANDTNIYVYAELYNLQYGMNSKDSFKLEYRVYSEDGHLYHDFGNYSLPKPGSSAVITNILNVGGWPSGKYDLNLTASDPAVGSSIEAMRRFFIFPRSGSRSGLITYTQKSPLDTTSLQTKSQLIKYLIEPQDWELYESLTDVGKGSFVERFFEGKDPDPSTEENEYLIDAMNRYNYATTHFYSPFGESEGWRTDMGRVLMQYGVAENSKEGIMPSNMDPWIIWFYYGQQEGIYFVFVDREGYGDFRLVHSNADGEPQNKEYDNLIYGIDINEPQIAD